MQAIILCGGKGTRLKSALPKGLPKAMAEVCGKPFLYHLMEYWEPYVDRFILATGYGKNKITEYFGNEFKRTSIVYTECTDGTAAAIKNAIEEILIKENGDPYSRQIFVINGDTYFEISPFEMLEFHKKSGEHITLSYSSREQIHAGVDILELRPKYHTRGTIVTHPGYFIDIGTPERLAEFRAYISEKA